jgi:hypothetical protein
MISKKEEQIYNSHLYTSRSVKNKPTRFRNNFDNLADKDVVYLKKLSKFFYNYKHINLQDWFMAPYKIYTGENEYYDLHFYTTRKALKCYTMYIKQQETEDPDSDDVSKRMKECLAFVYRYCVENNMTLDQYKQSRIENLPTIVVHLKEHKINFYTLHLLEVDAIIKTVETAILNFIVGDFWNTFSQTRVKFANSNYLKQKTRKAKKQIQQKLVENQKK